MNSAVSTRLTLVQLLALFCGIVLILLLSMHYRLGPELADDGAFFLRYAENMLKGEFWVWNPGEAPVWGASAPLYPLLVAVPMAFGLSPEAAIIGVGLALSSISLAGVTLMLGHRFGFVTGLAFLVFAALDTELMYFAGSGLETPLTIALLALALWTLIYEPRAWVVGLVAGLLMVNKLDLVPAGALLLLAHWIKDKCFPKSAVVIASAIVLAWYVFAWWYFGAPVPNSFLTKSLYQNDLPKLIDWTWFGLFVLWAGAHKWLVGFSIFAAWSGVREFLSFFVLMGGVVLIHLAAYTVKYPFEPYNWYGMPSVFSLMVLGAAGVGVVSDYLSHWLGSKFLVGFAVSIALLGGVVSASIGFERQRVHDIKIFSSHHEYDRSEAGRWVAENTPAEFVVFSSWGNPAYYSQRKVIDGSFLNRRYEPVDLVAHYRPEILILQNNPGSTPMNPVFAATKGEEYRVVKVFDKTYSVGMDYFFVVLAREDVLDRVRGIDPPRDLTKFVQNVELGDQFGILRPSGVGTLFVHPGATTATRFGFRADQYVGDNGNKDVSLHARIAPNVPQDAIQRGAGNVRLRVRSGEDVLVDAVVKVGEPLVRAIPAGAVQLLTFDVDNNGGADTDWLLLSIR